MAVEKGLEEIDIVLRDDDRVTVDHGQVAPFRFLHQLRDDQIHVGPRDGVERNPGDLADGEGLDQ